MRKDKLLGLDKVGWAFAFIAAACNLVMLPKLLVGRRPREAQIRAHHGFQRPLRIVEMNN